MSAPVQEHVQAWVEKKMLFDHTALCSVATASPRSGPALQRSPRVTGVPIRGPQRRDHLHEIVPQNHRTHPTHPALDH